MTSILDMSPYPWSRPEARQLHVELYRTFPNPQDAQRLAGAAEMNVFALNANQPPTLLWQQILEQAAPMGLARALGQVVHDQLPRTAELRTFVAELLADRPVATSGEQRAADGTPSFVTAFVIQHPLGGRKRVAYVRNTVSFFDDRVVHYLSDTQVGSSGSPVLNAGGQLIALHHAGAARRRSPARTRC